MTPEFDKFAGEYQALLHNPVREYFAPGSQFFHSRKLMLLQAYLREQHILPERTSWLDVGCGTGELLSLGAPAFRTACGCDPSAGMLQQCRGNFTVTRQNDPHKIPFPDCSFDLLTAVCIYHHIPVHERAQLVAEAMRVLTPSGVFCIIEHNPINPITQWIVSRTVVDADAQLLTARQSRCLMAAAGFTSIETTYFLYLPQSLYTRLSRIEALLSGMPFGGQYAVFARRDTAAAARPMRKLPARSGKRERTEGLRAIHR